MINNRRKAALMAEAQALPLTVRATTGKGASRALRRAGRVPCTLYGGGEAPVSAHLAGNELQRTMRRGRFFSALLDLDVDGRRMRAIPRDVQFDVVRDVPIHVDFLRITPQSQINIYVPVAFVNESESPGIRRGGVLNVVRHEVELKVRVGDIPEGLEVDLAGLDIGDVVHISAVALPAGASPTISDRDFVVATVAAPSAIVAAARAEQEATAGEEPSDSSEA